MNVTFEDIRQAVRTLGLAGRAVCVHASLRSFGHVIGPGRQAQGKGADTVVEAFLAEGCTLLVPSHSWSFAMPPPVDQRIDRNGWDYDSYVGPTGGIGRIYTTDTGHLDAFEIDKTMGAIAHAVTVHPDRVRGNHPICSFSAVGPQAEALIAPQGPLDVFAPLRALAELGGFVLLMGVDLRSLTILHLAEKVAGRTLFRRWANDRNGEPMAVEVGGCSDGFVKFEEVLRGALLETTVGKSRWRVGEAKAILNLASDAIAADAKITHCGRSDCERCADGVAGGPLVS